MTESAPEISIQVMIDEIRTIGFGVKDMVDRARGGALKRPPDWIATKTKQLEILRAVHRLLEREKAKG